MIQFKNVSKEIGGTPIIRNFSLTIGTGEATCLCGPSGIGKTTLLEIGAKLTTPDSGAIHHGSKTIGCAFQDDILIPWLTAQNNIELVLHSRMSNTRDVAEQWLKFFELSPDMKPPKMSGGMRRRLSLARAFAINPLILLLDEPFAFLDEEWQEKVAHLIENQRANGSAILLVSHQTRQLETFNCRTIQITTAPITHCLNRATTSVGPLLSATMQN